jgi:hypothetical protein
VTTNNDNNVKQVEVIDISDNDKQQSTDGVNDDDKDKQMKTAADEESKKPMKKLVRVFHMAGGMLFFCFYF